MLAPEKIDTLWAHTTTMKKIVIKLNASGDGALSRMLAPMLFNVTAMMVVRCVRVAAVDISMRAT